MSHEVYEFGDQGRLVHSYCADEWKKANSVRDVSGKIVSIPNALYIHHKSAFPGRCDHCGRNLYFGPPKKKGSDNE